MNGSALLAEARSVGVNADTRLKFHHAIQAERDAMGSVQFTLLLIKSFAQSRQANALQDIVEIVAHSGLRVVCARTVSFSRMDALRLAIISVQENGLQLDMQQHAAMLESLLAGPAEALIVAGDEAVTRLKHLLGPDDPVNAKQMHPASLRARYGGDRLLHNGLHCSGL